MATAAFGLLGFSPDYLGILSIPSGYAVWCRLYVGLRVTWLWKRCSLNTSIRVNAEKLKIYCSLKFKILEHFDKTWIYLYSNGSIVKHYWKRPLESIVAVLAVNWFIKDHR